MSRPLVVEGVRKRFGDVPVLGGGLDKASANRQYGPAVFGADSATPVLEYLDQLPVDQNRKDFR